MAWQDRIREAAYNSPSGNRFVFEYEDVKRNFEKKTTAFEFPDAPGTYIQDKGKTGFRYPFRLIFWGDDYDIISADFENALGETGIGKLEHPIYGTVDVVPFGNVSRRDDLKTSGNQAVFDVSFWETTGLIYPSPQADPGSQVINSVDEYNFAAADELNETVDTGTSLNRTSFENTYTGLLDRAKTLLQPVADTQNNIRNQFNSIYDSINTGIDILVEDPVSLGMQTVLLIESPARALANIETRLNEYKSLSENIITRLNSAAPGDSEIKISNEFHAKDIFASTAVAGSIVSVVNNQFITKPKALEAAEAILNQMETVTDWRDENFENLSEIDTGGSYQKLQNSVALAAGFLVEISFTLKQERNIVLDRDRSIIDLEAELYGTIDVNLDFLISTNDLSGSEHIEIKRGRNIVYYI